MKPIYILILGVALALFTSPYAACALPDNRAYEMVSPTEKNGVGVGLAVSASNGEAADWLGIGGLDGATSAGVELYQSRRTADGWQTVALTPKSPAPLRFLQEQSPLFWTPDLTKTIYTTPTSYSALDQDNGALDLYLQLPDGSLNWISQGIQGGSAPLNVTFDGSTPDAEHVVFSTEESLLPQATGIEPNDYRATQYLYVRNVAQGQTELIDVDNSGKLLGPEGAILGNGNWLNREELPASSFLSADVEGTTTHAISIDGSKVFFESPPPSSYEAELRSEFSHTVHLYMRTGGETVPIDNPAIATGPGARYEGASEDGSLVFFSSDEALGGDPFADKELYAFDTRSRTVIPISVGEGGSDGKVMGVTAIANDGSRVYFVAKGLLATNTNSQGQGAVEGDPNLYVYDTSAHMTSFIVTLSLKDTESEPGRPGPLTGEPDFERPAVPTPDGSVFIFDSSADLTNQNSSGYFELYRFQANTGELVCISCTPVGIMPTGSASMAGGGGGSYGPPGAPLTMSADGSRIFFDTPDALVPEDINGGTFLVAAFGTLRTHDVYEWENGTVSLISDGRSSRGSLLDGTTPSGNDVFFNTAATLVPQDTDGAEQNIYDARVGGGFASAGTPPAPAGATSSAPCSSGTSCHPPTSLSPSFEVPGSALLQESSNLTPHVNVKLKPKHKPKTKSRKKASKKHKQSTSKAGAGTKGKARKAVHDELAHRGRSR